MEDSRKALRPSISTAPAGNPAEHFQNVVLRPILKLQNELILSLYRHFLGKRKVSFPGFSTEKKMKWIEESLSQDNRLRGLMLGLVLGQFTPEELQAYFSDESELRRRIFSLMTQRLQDQMESLQ